MGKQLGVIQYRGKLGQTVGVKKSAGQKANTIRVRVDTIRNPKTAAQVSRRMRMAPAVNLYRALSGILNHSWQGVPYGGASHNEFMKRALTAEVFPYVPKGDNTPYPGIYQVADGSIAPMAVSVSASAVSIPFDSNDELSFTERILNANPQLMSGDQLTFVFCIADDAPFADPKVMWLVRRFIVGDEQPDWLSAGVSSADVDLVDLVSSDGMSYYAGAVIISRPVVSQSSGSVTWQRSKAVMQVVSEVLASLISANALDTAKASYSAQSADPSSDWYLNQGEVGEEPANMLTLSVTKDPEAGGTVTGGGSYASGTAVTVSATPAANYTFLGWYRDNAQVSTQASYSFVMASSLTLQARFQLQDNP